MENEMEMISELERGIYCTAWAIKLRCSKNGNITGWVCANEITGQCLDLPAIQYHRKPQA